jgi:hypothetical protein
VPNKIYLASETPLLFADAAQTPTRQLTLTALAQNTGRVSAQHDRGATSGARLYEWRLRCSLTGTNVVGATIELYAFTSDGTNVDGEVGTADAALTTDKRNNGKPLGLLIVDQTTTNVIMSASGVVLVTARYFSLGVWNATTLPLTTGTSLHRVTMTPLVWEIQ